MSEKRVGPEGLVGASCEIVSSRLGPYTEVGPFNYLEHVDFGAFSYTGPWCIIQNADIGPFANIAAAARIGPTDHPMDRPCQHHLTYRRRMYGLSESDDEGLFASRRAARLSLGPDIWIGHGATVMPGVRMGAGSVLGAGAVLTKDLPPFAVAVGVPARTIRFRFSPEEIEALLAIAWWEWGYERIKESLPDLSLPVAEFIEKHGRGI
jgi:hypothetical protein